MLSGSCFETLLQGLLAFQEEAVKYIARIKVVSGDRPPEWVRRDGAPADACARARSIERDDGTVRGAHEAVPHVAPNDNVLRL